MPAAKSRTDFRNKFRNSRANAPKLGGQTQDLAVFLGASFNFFKVLCLFSCFPVPEPSKQAGDVFKCIGDVFCIEFAYGNE